MQRSFAARPVDIVSAKVEVHPFGLNAPTDEMLRNLSLLPKKGSIRGVA